ncbi:MAG: cadherin domain-containing protein [Verrucomicrobiota bacterium]
MKRTFVVLFGCLLLAGIVIVFLLSNGQNAKPTTSKNNGDQKEASLTSPPPAGRQPALPATAAMPLASNVGPGMVSTNATTVVTFASPRKRAWDPQFLAQLTNATEGDVIRFELVGGEWASGTIQHIEHKDNELTFVSGPLTLPEAGRFFFQKQSRSGKAGEFVGVVEFPKSARAFRLEPTGLDGAAELVERPLKEVLCLQLPAATDGSSNDVEEIPPLRPTDFPTVPIPAYQNGIIVLESLPGSTPVLYLDFQGGYTPTWGGITYDRPNVNNAQIRDVWVRVAEDYMPFNINVTTDLKVYQNAPEGSRQRVVLTPTTTAAPGAGGVAYIGSFNWTGDTPCWAFYSSGKNAAEVVAHEVGHTLGLGHDTQDPPGGAHVEYYAGHGSGDTGWAPIMGVGYYQNVSQWSKGEYLNASQLQDDIAIITSNNNDVDYRADDTGADLGTSRYLEIYSATSAGAQGVIETTGDTDAFQFTTTGGLVSLRADPVSVSPDLAIQATLFDASDVLLASNNPQTTLWAAINTTVPAGTYTFRVTGVGRNNPLNTGFSDYASLGYYSVTGSVANARLPNRFAIPENTTNGTFVGTVPATNPGGDPLVYTITSGNTGGTFTIDASGNLSIADNSLLNYEALAANTSFPVQFELFMDIENTLTPALTELNRRVVVAITNVNESPALTGFTASVLEHSQPGTALGTVTGSDPDFYTLLSYSITGGNSNAMFTIGGQSGVISVAGDLNAATQSVYNLTVVANDQTPPLSLTATSTVTINVLSNNSPFRPGTISYAVYTNITGTAVSGLTASPTYPNNPAFEKQLTLFEADTDRGDNYGAVVRGYLIAPFSGSYTFWIASDDDSQLFMSTSTNATTLSQIASVTGYTGPREWNKFSSQRSAPRTLTAGQAYYVEVRQKEGTGGDNLAVAWQCTSAGITGTNVIPGTFLAPYFRNYIPRATAFTTSLHKDAVTGARVGTVTFTDVNTNDNHTVTIASGNTGGVFAINPTNGIVRVASDAALLATGLTTFNLVISVTDNGVPALSGNATAVVNIVASNQITTTTPRQEVWTNLTGNTVNLLTSQARYPKRPDLLRAITTFDSGQDFADNYGSRIQAYLTPTNSGSFRFYVSSDDNSQFKYSPTTNPATATVVASITGDGNWSSYLQWDKFASQIAAPVSLTSGQKYYLDAIQKEGTGGDHVEVGWTIPGVTGTNIIASSFLTPVDINYAPDLLGKTVSIPLTASNGTVVTTMTATDSPLDLIAYKIVAGNSNNTFAIDADNGKITVSNNTWIINQLLPNFTLLVQAQDSGYGDLYPRKSTNVTVIVNLTEPAAQTWTGNGTDDNWTSGANWNGTAPVESTPLVFAGINRRTNFNDLLSVAGPVTLNNGGFRLTGNPLLLRAGLANTGDNTWAINSTFNKPTTINNTSGTLTVEGTLNNGSSLLTLLANGPLQVNGIISGTGGILKAGSAITTLSASNTFTGPTTVTTGTLALAGTGSLRNSSALTVMSGATLDASTAAGGLIVPTSQTLAGNGIVLGDTIVNGTLMPGASFGTLSFSNALTLAGSTIVEINKTGVTLASDLVIVGGTLTYGGSLTLTNTGAALAAGDTFDLFDAAASASSFATLSLPPLSPGLLWNTTGLALDGTVRVAAVPSPVIQTWTYSGTTFTLQLASTAGVNYVLQGATNLVAPINWTSLSTNAGTGGLLTIPAPVTLGEPQQFYRLQAY